MQTFKEGDQVSHKDFPKEVCYYVGEGYIERSYIERSGNNGWDRDNSIPNSYVSKAGNTYWGVYDNELTLVKPAVPEIEVGDTVEYLGSEAIVGCIHGGQAYASFYKNETFSFDNDSGGTCDEHKTFMGFPLDQMKLISKGSKLPYKKINVGVDNAYGKDEVITCSVEVLKNGFMSEYGEVEMYKEGQPLIDKIKTTMTNIKDFVKTSLLSKEEKLLRKHGFKQTECGEYTEAAKQFAIEALCKQQETEMIKVAEAMEEEANKDNK